jgi:L-fuconolactonase
VHRQSRIDAHAHVFRRFSARYPRPVSEVYPVGREACAEDLLATMDRHQVDVALLIAISPDDEYLAECIQVRPDRFWAVPTLDPRSPTALAQLAHKAETLRPHGIRLQWLGLPGSDPDQLPALPVLSEMAERGLPLWFFGPPGQLALLDAVLGRLRLTVVLDHLGFPMTRARSDRFGRPIAPASPESLTTVLELARHPNVHIALCGQATFTDEPYPHPGLATAVNRLYRAFGAERLLWGSDFPFCIPEPGYEGTLRLIEHHLSNLSPGELDAILGGNAAQIAG